MHPPKLIYVLGCNHALQKPPGFDTTPAIRLQIDEYSQELRSLAATYRFSLYCEEINHSAFSLAESFAIDRRKRYVNVDMPKDVRCKFEIPLNYADPANAGGYRLEQIAEWHEIREDYMYERSTDRMTPETVALIICGHEHLERLTLRFRSLGGRVESATILSKAWYRPELFTIEYYLDS